MGTVMVVDDVELLAQAELFTGLDGDGVARVARRARRIRLDRNASVFNEGDEPDALYVVTEGRVAIVKSSADGRDSVVALMESGDLFGELGMFDPDGGRTATARAL